MKKVTAVLLVLLATSAVPALAQLSPDHFGPMKARSIGPAGMSGRVSAVDVVLRDRNVIYVGAATGGLWKSVDGGLEWEPVFDEQRSLGIGAVKVFQANPDIVWVGGGEGNPRNSAGVGTGVYRTRDGGRTWTHLGLENSERIHRIVLHPTDPDVAWVGAMGPAWSDGGERGVYKTEDGGMTWTPVLEVNPRTGVADLVMDPTNPNKLFAAMWEYRRWPWFFESGGEGSGLYMTLDGGESWQRLDEGNGLPDGELGRMGLAFAPSNPDVLYALVEAERSELLRSDDGGRSFRTISDRPGIAPRPFYYADIRVDPRNENRIYSLHSAIQVSEDAGDTFRTVVPSAIIHGDVHELWIDPDDPRRMIIGEDGGIAFTYNRGETWRFVENLPLAQFYHINVDMEVPYNVYGGLQDNGSWYGPNTVWEDRGIMNAHWRRVGGGDGFATLNDFSDSRYGFTLSQQGNLTRFDKWTGERRYIRPVHRHGAEFRFHWNAALQVDPHDSTTIYLGSQFLHRSRDQGATWEMISPDLSTDDRSKQEQTESGGLTLDATGAENHTTILTIAPSPLEPGVIWVGTDDGNLQITRDDAVNWDNVAGRIRGAPREGWVPHIEPSRHRAGVAYVVFDEHRKGDWTPYVFRTDDYGRSWESLSTPEIDGFVHVIEEDPVEPNLLYLGTEFGLYVSLDRGESWMSWRHGMPPAPVRALTVHPRDGDLVIGTHGRAAWILDDVRPLRMLAANPSMANSPIGIGGLAPAQQYWVAERIGYRSTGHAMQFGENRPYGALIHYWVGQETQESATIEILDEGGSLVRTLTGPTERGLNRVVWDLRRAPWEGVGGRGGGPEVIPGTFRVRVRIGTFEAETNLQVLPDPRMDIPLAERQEKMAAMSEVADWLRQANDQRERLADAIASLDRVLAMLDRPEDAALRARGDSVRTILQGMNERMFTGPDCQGICGGDPVIDEVRAPMRYLSSSWRAPSMTDRESMEQGSIALGEILLEVNRVISRDLNNFAEEVRASGFSVFRDGGG